jgi:hypothetical protein
MSEGNFDVWLLDFAGSPDAAAALQRWFGIDEARARRILATLPRVVRHGAPALEAEEMAAALRILGAKVDVRAAAPDPKASGMDLVRPDRKRASVRDLESEGGAAHGTGGQSTSDDAARVADPRLDLDAPLDIGPSRRSVPPGRAGATATASGEAAAIAPSAAASGPVPSGPAPKTSGAKTSAASASAPGRAPIASVPTEASLDPLDPFAACGAPLELEMAPPPEEKPKPVLRTGVDADAMKRIQERREGEDDPEAAKAKKRFTVPPWLLRTVVGTVLGGLVLFALRTAGRHFVHRDEPIEVPTVSDEERTLSTAVEMDAFLAREGARFGIEQTRNRQLATQVRSAGAARVLAGDLVDVDDGQVATTLVIELPASPARRRRIMTAVESYETRAVVDPATVQMPPPEQRYLFVEMR